MLFGWSKIHELEVGEEYPLALDALEERLRADPFDPEAVIRLGFNLWCTSDGWWSRATIRWSWAGLPNHGVS